LSRQRQLNALLFELQSASSPLEQAKAIARAWRTVRDLAPADRRLLARHAGFDGAEQLLEGLASRRGGSVPSRLLELLGELRQRDGNDVADLVSSLSRSGEHAESAEDENAKRPPPVNEELADLGTDVAGSASSVVSSRVDAPGGGSGDETVAALDALRKAGGDESTDEPGEAGRTCKVNPGGGPVENDGGDDATAVLVRGPAATGDSPLPAAIPALLQEWRTLTEAPEIARADQKSLPGAGRAPNQQLAGVTAGADDGVGAGVPVLERFRWLKRRLDTDSAASAANRLQMVHAFADGWQRRRAVVAVLESGAVRSSSEGLDLIAALGRELDRRWCLRVLLEMTDVRGAEAERASQLVPERAGGRLLRRPVR
jgi:hypothetical protein